MAENREMLKRAPLEEKIEDEDEREIARVIAVLKEKYNAHHISQLFVIKCELQQLAEKYDGLKNIKDKRILDLGCGAQSGTIETDEFDSDRVTRSFEPWFCRALVELGAQPVGVDIGNNTGEPFENHRIDLSKTGTLDIFPDKSFDGIYIRLLFTSPQLEAMLPERDKLQMKQEIKKQISRLLKDNGQIIKFDEGAF